MLLSLMMQYSPERMKLLVFDSKLVDYASFNGVPHLMIPVTNETRKADAMLHWLSIEVNERLQDIKEGKNIDNKAHIVCVMDDFSGLSNNEEALEILFDILKKARATKIHCILCTGLPIAKIVPSELKILIPCRIAFSSVSKIASRIIIDDSGAELLDVPGEILFKENNKMIKCRNVYVTETDMSIVLNIIKYELEEYIVD